VLVACVSASRYRLHHESPNNVDMTKELEDERLQRVARMNESAKPPPIKAPEVKRK
jgi:hypothetical protein